jgi:hypothetical protein
MEENTSLATQSTSTSFNIATLNLAENNPYVIVAKTGTTVTPYPFERLKFESNRQQRFSILTSDVVIVKRHYHPDLGYILSDGLNDKYFDKSPSVVYLYPIVHYTDCSDKGKPLSDRMQVKMLQCNKDMYNYIVGIQDIKGDVTQFDFLGSLLPGNDRFPKTQLLEAGPALWKNNPKAGEYIETYMKQNGDRFLSSVGKIYTPEKLEDLLGYNGSSVKETVDQDLDDIFKPV